MVKKHVSLNKMLVIGTIVLFLGVGVQPAIATVNPKEKIIFDTSKDYLFQIIIDIANNPDVMNLLEQYDNDFVLFHNWLTLRMVVPSAEAIQEIRGGGELHITRHKLEIKGLLQWIIDYLQNTIYPFLQQKAG